MSFLKSLLAVEINQEVYDMILKEYDEYIVEVDNLNEYKNGYSNKKIIYKDKYKDEFICLARFLMYTESKFTETISGALGGPNQSWKQLICRLRAEQEEQIEKDYTGPQCKLIMERDYLGKVLSKEEIDKRLFEFEAEYDPSLAQYYVRYTYDEGKIIKHKNCTKIDIHKAYLSALSIIFPEAKEQLLRLGRECKADKRKKKIANYYVGMLAHYKVHRKTYNWIVQYITKIVLAAIDKYVDTFDSAIIYGRTDSLCISNPKCEIIDSDEIGEFGIEYKGDVYTYRDSNYIAYQFGDLIKGNLPLYLRGNMDLRIGKVVHYTKKKVGNHFEYLNVRTEIINEN